MGRSLIRFLGTSLLIMGSTVVFILIHTLLPFPFNQINSIFIVILFLIFFTRLSSVAWFIMVSGYLLELYSIHPFGVVLGSMLIAGLVGFFFFQRFLNLFSLASFFVLLLLLISVNRLCTWILMSLVEHGTGLLSMWRTDLLHLFWEFVMSSMVFLIVYAIIHTKYKGTRPEYIRV